MSKALILGATVLAFSAVGASAQPGYDYGASARGYGYDYPALYDYAAPAYGYGAPAYGAPATVYAAPSVYAAPAPVYRAPLYNYAPGYWGGRGYWRGYGYGWR
jgi:hypothetical protein